MKSIENIIKEALIKETNSSIKIDDSHFFTVIADERKNGKIKCPFLLIRFVLWALIYILSSIWVEVIALFKKKIADEKEKEKEKENDKKRLWKFVLLSVAFILSITIVASSFVFFINDVLLFQNDTHINAQGAIIPNRSCNRQSVIYLLNSADEWANTGVQLQKGDKIKISVSGGFHSDIAMMKNAADYNYKPKYEWVTFKKNKPDNNKNLLYNKDDAFFGSILFQIASESGAENSETDNSKNVGAGIIQQINGQVYEGKVKRNGILYLSVNDIYLTDSVIKRLESENTDSLKNCNITTTQEFFTDKQIDTIRGRLPLYFVENDTLVYYKGNKFKEYFQKNRDAFFNDNLGEVLVVIDIDRKLNVFSCHSSWYRETEARINKILDVPSHRWYNNLWKGIQVIGVFIVSIICLICKLFLIVSELWYISVPLLLLLYFFYETIKRKYDEYKEEIFKITENMKEKENIENYLKKIDKIVNDFIRHMHNFLHHGK